jgi:hypothetical protein
MEKDRRAEIVFEQVWNNISLDKARLRSLNEKDKNELKSLMRAMFMSSLSAGAAVSEATRVAQEINLNVSGADKDEVEKTVRSVLKEELSGLFSILDELKNRALPAGYVGARGKEAKLEDDVVVALHEAMFRTDMKTNIDDVSVEGKEVGGVQTNLEALRKLQKGNK